MALSPTWRRVAVAGDDRRALPDQPGRRGRLPAVPLRRQGAHRRGPGAGRQGARGARRAAPTWSGSSTSSRAASGTGTTHAAAAGLGGPPRAGRASTGPQHPGAVERAHGRPAARRHRHADLHLRHDRAAQGRDAVGGQRGVRDPDAGRRRRVHLPAARPATTCTLSYLPLCHVAERIFTTWFNAGAGVQVNFAESIATVQPNLREVQPTILFGVPRIWEKLLAGVEHPAGRRLAGSSGQRRGFWLGVADRIGATPRRAPAAGTPPAPGCATRVGWLFFYRALRERIGHAPGPLRRVRRRADRARRAAVLHGHRRADARGVRHDREHRGRHRQPARPGQARHGRRAAGRRRAAHRRGDRRDPHPAPRRVRRATSATPRRPRGR